MTAHPLLRWSPVLVLLALQACQTPPQDSVPAPAPAAVHKPVAPSPPPPPPPPPKLVPRTDAEIRQFLDAARNALDLGQEDAALTEVDKVLASDPEHKVALTLQRQIQDDPQALYGTASFPYRVVAGDGLALIAQRFMGDRDQFYGLARYNGIRSPRQLAVGQTIRIPGTAPRVMPPPAPAPEPAPTPAAAIAPAPAPAPPPPTAAQTQAKVTAASRRARAALARQDVCGAIAGWDEVLRLEPGNRTATLERDRALDLKKRLPDAKC
ncbi:MAG: LysM peptidoglycan-binding domain-containing protein [Proteobacteria bacterium]|nr:LysM peptidoglycan-binding domain-containing protein [Pseudomonadota bacterium]